MIEGIYVILKDKQFYNYKMQRVAIDNVKLLHILDLDLNKGALKNKDVYDNLTYKMHVQVEIHKEIPELLDLLDFNVRLIAVNGIFKNKDIYKGILVKESKDIIPGFKDYIVENPDITKVPGRLFTINFYHKDAFAIIKKDF